MFDRPARARNALHVTSKPACKAIIVSAVTSVVAQPGVARVVIRRIAMTLPAATALTAMMIRQANSKRVKTASMNTEIALNPWVVSETRFIDDLPA